MNTHMGIEATIDTMTHTHSDRQTTTMRETRGEMRGYWTNLYCEVFNLLNQNQLYPATKLHKTVESE